MLNQDNALYQPGQSLVLIVDDIPNNIQLLGTILKQVGYRVAVAMNGEQALNSARSNRPDLILLDIMLPGIDGYEVCETLKSDDSFADVPIIFLSAKTETLDKVRGLKVGACDYVTKPFEAAEVLERVKTHLSLKKAMDTIRNYNQNLESMLEERTKELIRAERGAAFSILIQGIVHNLKNPLNGIIGHGELLQLDLEQLPKRNGQDVGEMVHGRLMESAKSIQVASQQMHDMIESLMTKSRSDDVDHSEMFDLNDVIKQDLAFLDADHRFRHGVAKLVALADRELPLNAVPGEVSQVLQNLIGNALDALHQCSDGRLELRSGCDQDWVWFEVADNGPGIPDQLQEKIFDPFFTTKRRIDEDGDTPSGTGLGLYSCYRIVSSYDGDIQLKTGDDGTCFRVRLPRLRCGHS